MLVFKLLFIILYTLKGVEEKVMTNQRILQGTLKPFFLQKFKAISQPAMLISTSIPTLLLYVWESPLGLHHLITHIITPYKDKITGNTCILT